MTGTLSLRTPMLIALSLTLGLLLAIADCSTAYAKSEKKPSAKKTAGKTVSSKVTKSKSKKNAKAHAGRRSASRSRRYTVRGNPEVTRRVATQLIAEKLPELAAIVNLQPDPSSDVPSTPAVPAAQLVASKGITGGSTFDAYQDSELDDNEDTDGITAEDEKDLEDLPVDINSFYKEFSTYMASLNGESTITDNGVDKVMVMETLIDWVGTRYLFGGMGRNGIDCSAFTGMVYRALNFKLPRTAAMQWEVGHAVEREDLQFGDLVFFHTRAAVYVSHVGMYLGNGMFAHASSRNGVTVSSLDAEYYSTHLIGARRYDLNTAVASSEGAMISHN